MKPLKIPKFNEAYQKLMAEIASNYAQKSSRIKRHISQAVNVAQSVKQELLADEQQKQRWGEVYINAQAEDLIERVIELYRMRIVGQVVNDFGQTDYYTLSVDETDLSTYFAVFDKDVVTKLHAIMLIGLQCQMADDGEAEEDASIAVNIKAWVNGEQTEANFWVQHELGKYRSELGCFILSDNGSGDCDFDSDESILFEAYDVVGIAEAYYQENITCQYEYINTNFNALIANQEILIKKHVETGKAMLVIRTSPTQTYEKSEEACMAFDSVEDAQEWLEQFRTSEHHDLAGLSYAIKKLRASL